MWDYEGFVAKAQLYFTRAKEYPRAEDDVMALWLLLGLEFLLRAPLAKISPTLLADPQSGDAIMHAAGYPIRSDGGTPKSIQAKTVIIRLGAVIPEFTKERQDDANFLIGLRNEELHSSESPLAIEIAKWLPHFTRVVEIIGAHLELDPADLVGDEIMDLGRELVNEADKKIEHEVNKRIEAAKVFFARLKPSEIDARRGARPKQITLFGEEPLIPHPDWPIDCPACKEEKIPLKLRPVRWTNERLENDEICREVVYIAIGLSCPICDLELAGTAEIRAAKIRQEYIRKEWESLEDRYSADYEADYGNE
ncbi:hypothetical protein [Microbispora sp. H13382]|uniref:hypothetical protein n=1 Tax=Microbispora sp. H13382 TaxID=2729112 RepID=UPI0016033696|nr:hypothetical protein [Microbispora sp. H13382]